MGGKSGGQISGFKYFMDLQIGLGRGPVNEITELRVGDQVAWSGSITDNGETPINAPDLFGGDYKEGGIVGSLRTYMGGAAQVYGADIKALLGGLVPDFRGIASLYFSGEVCANNPYPKEWKIRLNRSTAGWFGDAPWYPEKAQILMAGGAIKAMNPAHIIYECATNPQWARGLGAFRIDDASFRRAADQLYSESFGLCTPWARSDDIDAFVQTMIDHVGGALFTSRLTGLLTFNLIREDLSTPLFELDSGLMSIEDDSTAAVDQTVNEVIVKFSDPITHLEGAVRAQNLATWQSTQAFASTTKSYSAIPTKDLAARVALRDLKSYAPGLKRLKINLDRRGWRIQPGDAFRIHDPSNGLGVITLRAGVIKDGTMTEGGIVIGAIQDVFALPDTSYVATQVSAYVAPLRSPVPPLASALLEVTYRDLVRELSVADRNVVTVDQAYVGAVAVRPSGLALSYDLETAAAGEVLAKRANGHWTPYATLATALGPYSTAMTYENDVEAADVTVGSAVLIGGEHCRIDALDLSAKTMTVARGCVDTVPVAHALGAEIWFYDNDLTTDGREYANTEVISGKALTRTSSGVLAEADAPLLTLAVTARQGRPYPPGNVRVGGDPVLANRTIYPGDLVLTWTHRDRLLELDQLVPHGAASMGPEAGTTYTLRFYYSATLIRTVAALADVTFTYTAAMAVDDGNPHSVIVELEAVRAGLASFTKYRFTLHRVPGGYGEGYGENYGGFGP